MLKYLFILSILFTWYSCSEEQAPVDIYEIKNIGYLSTTEFTLGKVLKISDDQEWYKFGDRKILISTKAKIKAGVDLNALTEKDIEVVGKKIIIHLPAATINSFEMDPSDVKTEMVDVNGLRMGFTQVEKNAILKLGEKSIKKEMDTAKIIREAEKNALIFIEDFYKQLGFEEVEVDFQKQVNE